MNNDYREKFNSELREYIDEARKNRQKFLQPYKIDFENSDSRKKRAKIIIELIRIEPSHLSEPWIYLEIIEWLRSHDSIEYLEEAFVRQGGRKRLTERAKFKKNRDRLLVKKIDKLDEQSGHNVPLAEHFRQLANEQRDDPKSIFPEDNPDHDLPELIKKIYYEFKRGQRKIRGGLPYPYYGLDVTLEKGALELFFRK